MNACVNSRTADEGERSRNYRKLHFVSPDEGCHLSAVSTWLYSQTQAGGLSHILDSIYSYIAEKSIVTYKCLICTRFSRWFVKVICSEVLLFHLFAQRHLNKTSRPAVSSCCIKTCQGWTQSVEMNIFCICLQEMFFTAWCLRLIVSYIIIICCCGWWVATVQQWNLFDTPTSSTVNSFQSAQ